MITNRQKAIIEILLETDSSITCQDIAKEIEVSDRTVLNEIKNINKKLSEDNKLVIAKGKGIKLESKKTISELHKLYTSYDKDNDLTTQFIKTLLISNYFDQKRFSEELAEELYVSLNTLKRIIKDARIKLREYQIELIVDNKEGIKLRGNEKDIRQCMSNILFSSTDNYEYFLDEVDMFDRLEIEKIKDITLRVLDKNNLMLTYISFNSFIIHIIISILRENITVEYDKDFTDKLRKSKEREVVSDLLTEIESKLGYDIKNNIFYLTENLISSQKSLIDYRLEDEKKIIMRMLNNIISRINKEFSIDFSKDEMLINSLKMHLLTSLNRYRINTSIKHIDLSEIKNQYPIAYDMGIVASEEIEEILNTEIDDTEILFLALHFGTAFNRLDKSKSKARSSVLIVCGAGLSTAKFLKYSLLENFREDIEYVDVASFDDYNESLKTKYDIILSTLNNNYSIDGAIKVNYILNKMELDVLRNKLSMINNRDLLKVFKDELFYTKSFDSKSEILQFITDDLKGKGLVSNEDIDSIYEREKMGDTSLGNTVAIPHPLSYTSKEMNISVLINDKEVFWGQDEVRIVMLILVPNTKIEEWDNLFRKLFKAFNRRSVIEELYESVDITDFKDILIQEME